MNFKDKCIYHQSKIVDFDIIIYFFLQIFTQRNQLILILGKFHMTIVHLKKWASKNW